MKQTKKTIQKFNVLSARMGLFFKSPIFNATLVLCAALVGLSACDRELKEHPIPADMERRLEMKKDPTLQAKEITGTVSLDAALQDKVAAQTMLFIFARPKGVAGGPPLAVKRLRNVRLPYKFKIGPLDVMIPDTPFEGELDLTARLDSDGNAKASPGDIEGTLSTQAGTKDLSLVLNRQIPAPSAEKSQVTGVIDMGVDVASADFPQSAVLFLFARARGVERGPPLAVQRIAPVKFPFEFALGQQDAMMPGTLFEGKVTIIARLSMTGTAMPNPGDVEGYAAVTAGDAGLKITLDHVVPKEEP